MNRIHEKNLRTLLGISDARAVMTERAKNRVERMETRMTQFFGHSMEMQAEVLALLVNDLGNDQVFSVPKQRTAAPPKATPEEFIAKMTEESVKVELEKRGFELNGKESVDELRELLLESVKEKKVKETV